MLLSFLLLLIIPYSSQFTDATSTASDGSIGNEVPTVGWQSSPTTRGTWSIIIDCLVTLSLCVYTAIHPNVPRQGYTYWEFLRTRIKWVSVGIIAPELVVYTAWRQWISANHLNKQLIKSKKDRAVSMESVPGPSFLGNWSMVHSFFVEMGGFVIAREHGVNVTLTTKGVMRLVELGYELPRLSEGDILDRSKADPITKVLTCFQAAYMVVQVIGRRAADLPITMLEINTMGHVVCALTIYAFWFKKPLSIEIPIVMEEEWLNKQQQRITQKTEGFWSPAFWKRPREDQAKIHRSAGTLTETTTIREDNLFLVFLERLKELRLFDHIMEAGMEDVLRAEIYPGPPALNEPWKPTDVILVITGADLSDPEDSQTHIRTVIQETQLWPWLVTHIFQCSESLESLWPDHVTTLCLRQAMQIYLTLEDVIKWDRAWISLSTCGALESPEKWSDWKREFDSQAEAQSYTTFRSRNWPSGTGQLQTGHKLLGISILSLATGFYGGLHLLLWNSYFPTTGERYLWRICGSIIAASGVIAGYMVLIVSDRADPLPRYLKPIMWPFRRSILILSAVFGPTKVVNISTQLTLIAACVLGPCYVAARAFIVIECFISLRKLPVDAYKVPLWSEFWPHV